MQISLTRHNTCILNCFKIFWMFLQDKKDQKSAKYQKKNGWTNGVIAFSKTNR